MSESTTILSGLVGRELAAVTFVRDYVQFSFDGPVLTAVVDPVLHIKDQQYRRGDREYCNLLIRFINKAVTRASAENGKEMVLGFGNDSYITISLRDEDLKFGPEAVVFDTHHGPWDTWPDGRPPKE